MEKSRRPLDNGFYSRLMRLHEDEYSVPVIGNCARRNGGKFLPFHFFEPLFSLKNHISTREEFFSRPQLLTGPVDKSTLGEESIHRCSQGGVDAGLGIVAEQGYICSTWSRKMSEPPRSFGSVKPSTAKRNTTPQGLSRFACEGLCASFHGRARNAEREGS